MRFGVFWAFVEKQSSQNISKNVKKKKKQQKLAFDSSIDLKSI